MDFKIINLYQKRQIKINGLKINKPVAEMKISKILFKYLAY